MTKTDKERKRLIVGLDFGTTNSGVSWAESTATKLDEIYVVDSWPGVAREVSGKWKTPSRIAYAAENAGMNEDSWGFAIDPKARSYAWTKLLLDDKTDITEFDDPDLKRLDRYQGSGLFQLPPGKTATDVVADYLAKIYNHLMRELEKRLGKHILDVTPIDFWLTCPAIWSDKAKDATKKAAVRAGIASRPGDLIYLVPEPEAAAIATLKTLTKDGVDDAAKINGVVLVCDCGGGTVDITTYRIKKMKPKFEFEEVLVGSGGKAGSTYIDREFHRWMNVKFGDHFMKGVNPDKKGVGSRFMREFEALKCDFGSPTNQSHMYEVPLTMHGVEDGENYDSDESMVKFTKQDMQSFFDPVLAKIRALLSDQLEAIQVDAPGMKINTILLVGGFGDSPAVLDSVKDWADRNGGIQVYCPPFPQAAIVKGAALCGLGNTQVSKKLCRRHYGFDCGQPFREGIDPPEYGYWDDWEDEMYCRDRMEWLLSKGQTLQEDTSADTTCHCELTAHSRRHFEVDLFACNYNKPPERSTDPRVEKIGQIPVDMSKVDLSTLRWKYIKGKKWYSCKYEVEVLPASKAGVLMFKVRHRGKVIGETELNYDAA